MRHARVFCFSLVSFLYAGAAGAAEPKKSAAPSKDAAELTKLCQTEEKKARGQLSAIVKAKPAPKADPGALLTPFNDLLITIGNISNHAGLYSSVHPLLDVRAAAESCDQKISTLWTDLSMNRPLFDKMAALDTTTLDADGKRLVERQLRNFRRSGVDKDEKIRARIKKLRDEITIIGQEFGRNIREDVRFVEVDSVADLDGLPADYIKTRPPGKNGKIRITTDYPDYFPVMQYAKNGTLRRDLYMQFLSRAHPKNLDVLDRMLSKRHELAGLLGYESFAAYVTEDKMIKTDKRVAEFIDEVAGSARARSQKEAGELLTAKQKDIPDATQIDPWERGYYRERVRSEKYAFESQAVRPYFEYNKVRDGLLSLTAELFGIEYVRNATVKTWAPGVDVYDVMEAGKPLGRIYLDMHPRDGKFKHAAQFTWRTGAAGKQQPEGVLVCNFPEPKQDGAPALMEHGDVVTFFHEFGHLLHHIFGGQQKWMSFSGVATEWDFVEAPSQLFEEWAEDYGVLKRFAKHHETGAVIPEPLVTKLRAAKQFGRGEQMAQQMFFAALSLNYHNRDPKGLDTTAMLKELQAKYGVSPHVEGTFFQASFGHLDGYSAIYYTYAWSLAIAKDMLSKFQTDDGSKDLLNPNKARTYRAAILNPGGSRDAAHLIEGFLGRPYQFDAFRKWISE